MKQIAFILVVVLITSCNASLATKGKDGEPGKDGISGVSGKSDVKYRILGKGEYGGRTEKSFLVISDETAYKNIVGELNLQSSPDVNFENKIAVAVFMGQKNSGGYSVDIESVNLDNNTLVIYIKETVPSGVATMAITNPYCIVEIPKSDNVTVKF